jgi:PAS domain S-box-containing protein
VAVRTTGLALSAYVIGEQQAVSGRLNVAHDTLLGALIAMIAAVAIMAVTVVVGVRRGILVPFGRLRKAVAAVADGRYHRTIPAVGPAELADVSRDVELMRTRLVAALAERERAESSLRGVFDLAPDAMLGVGRDGAVVMANAQAVRLFGYAVHELVGRQAQTLVPEEWRADLADDTASYFADRRSRAQWDGATAAGLRRDGTTFPAEVRLSLLPTDSGTVVIVAVRDVTERRALEAERERLRVAAERERLQRRQQQSQRLESLGQLVGGVAHDFNNLLNVISGYADFNAEQIRALAAGDERFDPVLEDVEQVRVAAAQAIRLTRQLMTFAKSDSARRDVLDLNEVVVAAGQLLHRSLGEQIELVTVTDPDLWRVEGDRGQLEQVLVNLAVNARDAMPGGGRLTISTTNAEVDDYYAEQRPNLKPGRYCWLAVSDTGSGMDQATIDRVFEPFFSTKPRSRGTGLGLATVYGIVSGLGGIIDIYSEVGLGTTINVLLPEAGRPAAAAPAPSAARLASSPGRGEAILLVEDEPSLRAMAARILDRAGYRVREAADGASALLLAADPGQRVDLLVTDMVMPGMLGTEVAERAQAERPGLPVLFTTGYAQQVLDFHGIPAAELDIVQKPFNEPALLAGVRRALSRAPSSGQPAPGQPLPGHVVPRQPGPGQAGDQRAEADRARPAPSGRSPAGGGGGGDGEAPAPVRRENPE